METLIETKEDFENYLISVIEKSEGINIATLLNPSNPAGLKMTVKDKEFIRKLYLKKKDYGLSHLLMEIIPKYPEIICIDDTKQNKDAWVYKIDRNIDTHNIQNSNVRLSEKEKTSSLGEESVHEQTVESDTKLLSTTKVIEIQEEAEELYNALKDFDFIPQNIDYELVNNEEGIAGLKRINIIYTDAYTGGEPDTDVLPLGDTPEIPKTLDNIAGYLGIIAGAGAAGVALIVLSRKALRRR